MRLESGAGITASIAPAGIESGGPETEAVVVEAPQSHQLALKAKKIRTITEGILASIAPAGIEREHPPHRHACACGPQSHQLALKGCRRPAPPRRADGLNRTSWH